MPEEEVIVSREDDLSKALTHVLEVLTKLEPEGRRRVIETAATFFGFPHGSSAKTTPIRHTENDNASVAPFSEDRTVSPKQFLHEKEPRTDVERIACLAFYLTHYRGIQHFKTLDISKLNTEAAQIKFSNAALAVN